MRIRITGLAIVLALCPIVAQSETFQFDFDPFTPGIQNTTTISVGDAVEVHITITDATRLLGATTNVLFNADLLALLDIRENPADLNFDSTVSGQELNDVVNFFIQNVLVREPDWPLTADNPSDPEQFIDSQGFRSGVLLDLDGDNTLSGAELNRVVFEFIKDVRDPQGATERVIYWTDKLATRQQFAHNESVKVYDPPSVSNDGGAHPGTIRDLTTVLLARPEVANNNRLGFGFSSDVHGDAVLFTLRFQAKAAGIATLQFDKPQIIREEFQDIQTDVIDATGLNGTITIQ